MSDYRLTLRKIKLMLREQDFNANCRQLFQLVEQTYNSYYNQLAWDTQIKQIELQCNYLLEQLSLPTKSKLALELLITDLYKDCVQTRIDTIQITSKDKTK